MTTHYSSSPFAERKQKRSLNAKRRRRRRGERIFVNVPAAQILSRPFFSLTFEPGSPSLRKMHPPHVKKQMINKEPLKLQMIQHDSIRVPLFLLNCLRVDFIAWQVIISYHQTNNSIKIFENFNQRLFVPKIFIYLKCNWFFNNFSNNITYLIISHYTILNMTN